MEEETAAVAILSACSDGLKDYQTEWWYWTFYQMEWRVLHNGRDCWPRRGRAWTFGKYIAKAMGDAKSGEFVL